MYLKRLEMLGFKSFAARTILEFSTGITAVVGPNGAGKSNVADAMRWVLGEQSLRQLRGKKSDDIIFAGGHGKATAGMAEVSLTLDNSSGWMPSEYSEITVTRRSYRSGENEYLINKQKVRLKDVMFLLAQARIGHDSYTVVGQGLIDAALSLRAEERRGLFEDAAGIRPFQVQRADAEHRLQQTEQNLARLRDIVGEIEPRLGMLEAQSHRAVEFQRIEHELHNALFTWYGLQWRHLSALDDRAHLAEQEQETNVQQVEQQLQSFQECEQAFHNERQHLRTGVIEARKVVSEANAQVQRLERDLAVNEERRAGLVRQCAEQQQEEQRLRERRQTLMQHVGDLEARCRHADNTLQREATALTSLDATVAKAREVYEEDQRRFRAAQSDLIQVQARLGASQTDLGRQQKHLGDRTRMLAARREARSRAQQSHQILESRLTEERTNLDATRAEEQQIVYEKQAVESAIANAQQEREHLKNRRAEAERERRAITDRLNMLKSWRQNLSGYSDGVRALLRAPSERLPGIIGPLPQLGVAKAGFEVALEAALGPYIQAVVVQSFAHACVCLEYLRTTTTGKAMVLWLEDGDENRDRKERNVTADIPNFQQPICGFAWQYIQAEPHYLPLFRRLLGETVILSKSAEDNFVALPYESLVTLTGEVFHRNGWLSGGGNNTGASQGILTYERELRDLPAQLDTYTQQIAQLDATIRDVQQSQESQRAEQVTLERALQKVLARISGLSKTIGSTRREQERLQAELQATNSLEQQLAAEVSGLEQEVRAAQERVYLHEQSQHDMHDLVEQLQSEIEERARVYRQQQDDLGNARTALAVKRQEAASLHQQRTLLHTQVQDLASQGEQRLTRLSEAEQQRRSLEHYGTHVQAELEQAQGQAHLAIDKLKATERQTSDIDAQIGLLAEQTTQTRHARDELESVYRHCLLERQKTHDALEALLTHMQEEITDTDVAFITHAENNELPSGSTEGSQPSAGVRGVPASSPHLTPEESEMTKRPEEIESNETHIRQSRRQVDNLRSRIKNLGGYDPDAPQQYQETRTRFEFLSGQINDMDQAAQQLYAVIEQLDMTMTQQFERTFHAVNARFQEHFVTLFHGGNARLELTAAKSTSKESEIESSPIPSRVPAGIDVIVQPPGKKVQDLSLLSGGERALVSAALLFALLEVNPPPFCLLDEVDAALDESNVLRFCDILKQLAQRTQFIVITHNRVTMTAAQVIYGISMGGDSVSRLLSLQLEEATVK